MKTASLPLKQTWKQCNMNSNTVGRAITLEILSLAQSVNDVGIQAERPEEKARNGGEV